MTPTIPTKEPREVRSVTMSRRDFNLLPLAAREKIQTDAFIFAARNRLNFEIEKDERSQTVVLRFT